MQTYQTFVHALSPLHAGVGQGVGIIDLPIAREKATELPYLPGSSVKGTLRSMFSGTSDEVLIFGSTDDHAGSVQFSDQRLLFLPIRSLAGTFAWVTSPYLLHRCKRDAVDCGVSQASLTIPNPTAIDTCYIAKTTTMPETNTTVTSALRCTINNQQRVVLEDLDLSADEHGDVNAWATLLGARIFPNNPDWQAMLITNCCIVHDDLLRFLLGTATEVVPRIRLQPDKKTVEETGFWYEEALPTESILSGLVVLAPTKQALAKVTQAQDILTEVKTKTDAILQFGGKATVGRGLCRVQIVV